MRYVDEYRDPKVVRTLIDRIRGVTTRPWVIMEVCGGQTHSIVRYGLDRLLPVEIELVHGPGCPVCVTPLETIDRALAIAARPDVTFTSFGDMLRVPGSREDLLALQGPRRRHPHRVLAARRRARRPREPVAQGRLLRHRIRDDRPGERDGAARGQPARRRELLDARVARPRPADDRVDPPVEGQPRPGLPRPGSRLRDHGTAALRGARARSIARRSSSRGSSRSTCSRGSSGASRSSNAARPRSRTPTRARCHAMAAPRAAR